MTSKNRQPWIYYMILQWISVGATMIVLLLGVYLATLTQKTSEPHITQPRYATVQEEQAWQEKQLADTLKAIQESAR